MSIVNRCNEKMFIDMSTNTDIIEIIKSCNENITLTINPLDQSEKCYLLTTKKHAYYIHTYDPNLILQGIMNDDTVELSIREQYKKYICDISAVEDSDVNKNCCNCVSFVLYIKSDVNNMSEVLANYLYSLFISVNNINNCLKTFITRLYIDSSVFKIIAMIKNKDMNDSNSKIILEIFDYFFNNDKVEIYTYICPSFEKETTKKRTLRFLPLIDRYANIKVIREADGIVTCTDCHNIKKMIADNKIMMLYSFTDDFFKHYENGNELTHHNNIAPYSVWLFIYQLCNTYFKDKIPLANIYAGLFATSLQIKKDAYDIAIEKVKTFTNNVEKFFEENKDYKFKENVMNKLNIGFDENILLELFKDIISIERHYDMNKPIKILDIYDVEGSNIAKFFRSNIFLDIIEKPFMFEIVKSNEFYKIDSRYDKNIINFHLNRIGRINKTYSIKNKIFMFEHIEINAIVDSIMNNLQIHNLIDKDNIHTYLYNIVNKYKGDDKLCLLAIDSLFKFDDIIKLDGYINIEYNKEQAIENIDDEQYMGSTLSLSNYKIKYMDKDMKSIHTSNPYLIYSQKLSDLIGGSVYKYKYSKYSSKIKHMTQL